MMKIHIVSYIAILILAASCNPFHNAKSTTINGQTRTYGTEEAIKHPPVKVLLIEEQIASGFIIGSGPSYVILKETYTDQNGYFSLHHHLYSDVNYFLAVSPESIKNGYNYYKPDDYSDRALVYNKVQGVGGTLTKNCYLKARGWVKFEIDRQNPVSGVNYYIDLSGPVLLNFPPNNQLNVISPKVGGYTHKYYYYFNNSDTSHSNYSEVYVVPLDTISEKVVF